MRQQKFEAALRAILQRIEETGPTLTHNLIGDRKRATRALTDIATLARNAIQEAEDDRQDPDHR